MTGWCKGSVWVFCYYSNIVNWDLEWDSCNLVIFFEDWLRWQILGKWKKMAKEGDIWYVPPVLGWCCRSVCLWLHVALDCWLLTVGPAVSFGRWVVLWNGFILKQQRPWRSLQTSRHVGFPQWNGALGSEPIDRSVFCISFCLWHWQKKFFGQWSKVWCPGQQQWHPLGTCDK